MADTVSSVAMEAINLLIRVLQAMQTETVILLIAFAAHAIFSGRHTFIARYIGRIREPKSFKGAARQSKEAGAHDAESDSILSSPAVRCRRVDAAQGLGNIAEVTALRKFGAEGCLREALEAFQGFSPKTSCLYNTIIDVCVTCSDFAAAEKLMDEAVSVGLADRVTYNTMIKGHIQSGKFTTARATVAAMRSAGLQPNSVTFNELLCASMKHGMDTMWEVFNEMQSCNVIPNAITTSILLKCIQQSSLPADVERSMSIVEKMDDQMDEVLLSSVIEACIRSGRTDLLKRTLARQREVSRVPVQGAHTFGSLFRAYGVIGDLDGAWQEWRLMRAKKIMPTSITFGCMVEAVASNGDPDAALELIREAQADPMTSQLVNAVTYCSVLKSFSHQKNLTGAWKVYREIVQNGMPCSAAIFNALFDACARCGEMARTQSLLDDMVRQDVEPNLITWSSILKGYCQVNQLDKAFELLDLMKQTSQLTPDEVTYNTILDGCARQGKYDRGMALLEQMESAGVRPTNYTLSVLVKLANRGGYPEMCFKLAETLPEKYNFRPNIHVYNNIIQACTQHRFTPRALEVLEKMLVNKIHPDSRTFALLLRGCISAGMAKDAADLTRCAFGLDDEHPIVARFGKAALQVREGLPPDVASEVVEGLARRCYQEKIALQLFNDLRQVPWLKLDPKLPTMLAAKAARTLSGMKR